MQEIMLGATSISKIELLNGITLQNSGPYLYGHSSWALSKYNPKIYLRLTNAIGQSWIYDDTTPNLSWPESFAKI